MKWNHRTEGEAVMNTTERPSLNQMLPFEWIYWELIDKNEKQLAAGVQWLIGSWNQAQQNANWQASRRFWLGPHAKHEGQPMSDGAEASRSNQQEKPEEPTMPAVPPATEPAPLPDYLQEQLDRPRPIRIRDRAPAIEDRAQGAAIRPAVDPAAVAALRELVACKDLKASIKPYIELSPGVSYNEANDAMNARRAEYERRQPLAWEAARAALVPEMAPHKERDDGP